MIMIELLNKELKNINLICKAYYLVRVNKQDLIEKSRFYKAIITIISEAIHKPPSFTKALVEKLLELE